MVRKKISLDYVARATATEESSTEECHDEGVKPSMLDQDGLKDKWQPEEASCMNLQLRRFSLAQRGQK